MDENVELEFSVIRNERFIVQIKVSIQFVNFLSLLFSVSKLGTEPFLD
jgi:hypothetical protein